MYKGILSGILTIVLAVATALLPACELSLEETADLINDANIDPNLGGDPIAGGGDSDPIIDFDDSNTLILNIAEKISISGIVTKLAALEKPNNRGNIVYRSVAMPDAQVQLYKIEPDGTETAVPGATATTAADGSYTLSDVDTPDTGSGADTDYYYEVRAVSGTTVVSSPVAPVEDTTVNVSPATTIAADILTDVVDPQTVDDIPTPNYTTINAMRELTEQNVNKLGDSIEVPAATSSDDAAMVALANGIAAAGDNAETMYTAAKYESESIGVQNGPTTSQTDAASYIYRLAQDSCGSSGHGAITESAARALGVAFINKTKFTVQDVLTAYNSATGQQINSTEAISGYANSLSGISQTISQGSATTNSFTDSQKAAIYSRRDLRGATFTAATELDADQALTFMESLPAQDCNFSSGGNVTAMVAALTGDTTLQSPAISDVIIYADSGHGCDQNQGELRFVAKIKVYIPESSSATVSSVAVTSSDSTALGGNGTETLTLEGDTYNSNSDDNADLCVTADEEVTYTITATLSDSTTATTTAVRTHPIVAESIASLGSISLENGSETNPVVTTVKRPLITWTSPATQLATMLTNNPNTKTSIEAGNIEGASIKYMYEYAHYKVGGGGPISDNAMNAGGAAECYQIQANKLYDVDNFIPTIDCNVDGCAAALSTTSDQITCRIAIQTYYVDKYDNLLGQAAGNFRFICVDTNGDGDCGE